MVEIEYAQTVLEKGVLDKLKRVIGEKSTKEALSIAADFTVKHYGKV